MPDKMMNLPLGQIWFPSIGTLESSSQFTLLLCSTLFFKLGNINNTYLNVFAQLKTQFHCIYLP